MSQLSDRGTVLERCCGGRSTRKTVPAVPGCNKALQGLKEMHSPLADRIRPKTLDEVAGQEHLLKKGQVLRRIIESKQIPNMVFYGPSGIGKTTVAQIIASDTSMKLFKLNGTSASTADIKDVISHIDTLDTQNGILLYLDEIQYFNKKQQQSLLEFIENGKITLIASTTENPYFYIYNALLSRCTVFEFKPVSPEAVKKSIARAFSLLEEEKKTKLLIEDGVIEHISYACGGDVRKAVNAVELCVLSGKNTRQGIEITKEQSLQVSQKSAMRFDRDGDEHYDILSALQKSIRGSDENAALHYLARLLSGGDLLSACRRIMVTACEDIGLAYPQVIPIVKACIDAAVQVGLPEAQIPLGDAVILLATSPKSNSGICAISAAMRDVANGNFGDIPAHLKDSHYQGAKKMGRGLTYQYPHDFDNNYTKQQYLPDSIKNVKYYTPGSNKIEQAAEAYWDKIKKP